MNHYLKIAFLFILLTGIDQNTQAQSNNSIKQFDFMLGHWEMKTKKGKITESWRLSKEGMIGKSYRHEADGDSVLTERIVLSLVNDVFRFSVSGHEEINKGTTDFKLVSAKKGTFIFENKKHDFPQRIVYQYKGRNVLFAYIEGVINGKETKIEFPYQRKN